MEYYSAIERNTFESVLMRWMKLEPIIQSEVSQKVKHQYSVGGFPFLHTLSSIYCLQIFGLHHSDWCEVIPHCGFNLHLSNNQ